MNELYYLIGFHCVNIILQKNVKVHRNKVLMNKAQLKKRSNESSSTESNSYELSLNHNFDNKFE